MRTIRIYLPLAQGVALDHDIDLPTHTFNHLIKVLRLPLNASIDVFDGHGHLYQATLSRLEKKSAQIRLTQIKTGLKESPLHTHLGLVMSKGDRFDIALQKATELGVSAITPLTSDFCDVKLSSERADKKHTHWQKVIISACEQCQRNTLPILHPIKALETWASEQSSEINVVCHPTDGTGPIITQHPTPGSVSLLIGPEGGLSEHESRFCRTQAFQQWQLGARILRTETAPLVALSILQWQWGDLR